MLIPQMNAETIPIQDIQAGPKNAGLASYQPDSSFQKMIEKAMNESREADKARTEKQGREPRPENVREDSGAEKARQKDQPPGRRTLPETRTRGRASVWRRMCGKRTWLAPLWMKIRLP